MAKIPEEDLLPGENAPIVGQPQTFRPGYVNPYGPTINMTPAQSAARANVTNKQAAERDLDRKQAELKAAMDKAEEDRRKALYGDVPPGFVGPSVYGQGQGKFDIQINRIRDPNTGLLRYEYGTHDYDQYILNLPYDPNDAEYNRILHKAKQEAIGRERRRGLTVDPSQADTPAFVQRDIGVATNKQAAERDEAKAQAARDAGRATGAQDYTGGFHTGGEGGEDTAEHRQKVMDWNEEWYAENPVFVDANGNPINDPYSQEIPVGAQTANGLPKNNPSGLSLADANDAYDPDTQVDDIVGDADGGAVAGGGGSVNARDYVNNVGAVYVGQEPVQTKYGVQYRPVYRTQTDVEADIYRWSPGEVAAYQKAMGLKVTGVVDTQYTLKLWKVQVQSAANYASQGQNVGLDFVVAGYAKAARASGGGGGYGGGGGGGGGGAKMSRGQAKALLNPVMREYAGREASEGEVDAFLPAAQSAFNQDPEGFAADQFTIDWVKGRLPQEVGSLQAATNYYDVIRAVLGGGGGG